MISSKRGFTLLELLVVVAMIALLLGAMGSSVAAAQERARVQKATVEVKAVAQAVLAYENFSSANLANGADFKLDKLGSGSGGKGADVTEQNIGFLLGEENRERIPALLMAAMRKGEMKDPWGTTYKIYIGEGTIPKPTGDIGSMTIRYDLANRYRLTDGERTLILGTNNKK